METVGRIRRAHFVQKLSVREIARRLHVSRKTVRKAIEAEDGAFSYERAVQPMPRLGGHIAELERLLADNERKPRREKLTLVRLYEELRRLGYEGGYDAVRRHPSAALPRAAHAEPSWSAPPVAGSARRRGGPRPRSCR